MFCLECHENFDSQLLTDGKCPDCVFVINPNFSSKRSENNMLYYVCDSCGVQLVSTSQFDNEDNHRDKCLYAQTLKRRIIYGCK